MGTEDEIARNEGYAAGALNAQAEAQYQIDELKAELRELEMKHEHLANKIKNFIGLGVSAFNLEERNESF